MKKYPLKGSNQPYIIPLYQNLLDYLQNELIALDQM